jgi:cyclomaltodextrinase
MCELHQYLIGLRRRHPWLHRATTTALRLENRHYVYQTRAGDDALIVALNIDATPLRVRLADLAVGSAEVIAGSAAPPREVVDKLDVEPHGWRILRPV